MAPDPKELRKILIKWEDLLEAAFDDNVDDVQELMKGPPKLPMEPTQEAGFPAGTYSPLSEAAAGNAVAVTKYLLEHGADPNQKGEHCRTPLHRAVMNEHEEVVPLLLEGGADPRKLLPQEYEEVTDSEAEEEAEAAAAAAAAELPEGEELPPREKKKKVIPREWDADEIPCPAGIKKVLRTWDINKTFKMLDITVVARKSKKEKAKKEADAKKQELLGEEQALAEEAALAHQAWMDMVKTREHRIMEHDNCEYGGGNKEALVTLIPLIEEADAQVKLLKEKKDEIDAKLSAARGAVRKHEVDAAGGLQVNSTISLTQLPDVVVDAAGEIWQTGKCAVLIDGSENGRSYLKYRNVVMLEMHVAGHQSARSCVEAMLGSIKQGRTFILDVGPSSSDKHVEELLNSIAPNLYELVTTNALTKGTAYEALITDAVLKHCPEYERGNFPPVAVEKWRFMLLTANAYPDAAMLDTYYSIMINA
eukprot:TRINITY_DN30169_c0_g1_i1.p1 TRINITY_DN30169_c0_g1~~TRINITY_DN30169_c0_g1_i1.p1  ORF type:complete len:498 (+),score=211.86 TRINITY_DN30169_c0_g1_i1:62-1495(+)